MSAHAFLLQPFAGLLASVPCAVSPPETSLQGHAGAPPPSAPFIAD